MSINPTKVLQELVTEAASQDKEHKGRGLKSQPNVEYWFHTPELKQAIHEAQLFIFEEFDPKLIDLQASKEIVPIDPMEVDWPYDVMHIEVKDAPWACLNCSQDDNGTTGVQGQYRTPIIILFSSILINRRTGCFWAVADKHLAACGTSINHSLVVTQWKGDDVGIKGASDMAKIMAGLCTLYLDKLAESKIWRTKSNATVKYRNRTGKKKHIKIPKPICYIVGKSGGGGGGSGPGSGVQMVWTHQWRCRGHWRTLSSSTSLGKDRNDVYNQWGRTWVSDHIRGPDDKPLVEKYKVVRIK